MDRPVEPAVSADSLLGGRVRLLQPAAGYRVAIDPVLLAAAVAPPPGARVLDLGCGVGAAALCLLARRPDLALAGIELQPALAALARRNAEANGAAFEVCAGDAALGLEALPWGSFDAVLSNPPHLAAGAGGDGGNPIRTLANQESSLDLAGWIGRALRWLKPRGTLTLVHRADRLAEILAALQGPAGAIAVHPLWPKAGQAAKRVLVAAVKGSRAPGRLLPGLVLHGADGGFTPEAQAVLRDGAPLSLSLRPES